MEYRFLIRFVFNQVEVREMMNQLDIPWTTGKSPDWEWSHNVTRLVDAMTQWCHDSGIRNFGISHTQIGMAVTLGSQGSAMLFKLRWHDVGNPSQEQR